MRAWLSLALLGSVIAGCALDHTRSDRVDASGTGDGGLCAGTEECVIAVVPPATCTPVVIGRADVPRAVAMGSTVPVHVVSAAGSSTGCSCTPSASLDPSGQVSLSACDCCVDCPCIDQGYEATIELPAASTPGALAVSVAGALAPIATTIVDPARCTSSSVTVTEIVPLAPSATAAQGLPVGDWVEVRAFEMRCCGEPLELVTRASPGDGSILLQLAECNPDPCDCAPDARRDDDHVPVTSSSRPAVAKMSVSSL